MQSQFFHPTYVVNLGSLVCWIYAVEGSDLGVQRELQHFCYFVADPDFPIKLCRQSYR